MASVNRRPWMVIGCVLVALALARAARADVRLPHVFGSHMVLQRDMELPVWAGVVGLRTVVEEPEPDALLAAGVEPPAYLNELLFARAGSSAGGSNEQP